MNIKRHMKPVNMLCGYSLIRKVFLFDALSLQGELIKIKIRENDKKKKCHVQNVPSNISFVFMRSVFLFFFRFSILLLFLNFEKFKLLQVSVIHSNRGEALVHPLISSIIRIYFISHHAFLNTQKLKCLLCDKRKMEWKRADFILKTSE